VLNRHCAQSPAKEKMDIACASLGGIWSDDNEPLEITWENVCLKTMDKEACKK